MRSSWSAIACLRLLDLLAHHALRRRDLGGRDQRLERLVAGGVDLLDPLDPAEPLAQVGRAAPSRVSNSLASWANSSSSSGSSFSLTVRTVTATSASRPAKSPPTSWVVKVVVVAGGQADQRLVQARQELLAADLVGDVGRRAARHLLAVDGRVQVDLDVVAVAAPARSTVLSVANRSRRPSTCSSISSSPICELVDGRPRCCVRSGQGDLRPDVDLGGELQRLRRRRTR